MASSAETHALITRRGQSCACENCGSPGPKHADSCPKPGVRYCIPCGAQIEGVGISPTGREIQPWDHSDDCPKKAPSAA
jgi:ubiquitin